MRALIAASTLVLVLVLLYRVHGFLAVNKPIGRGILIVESWIPQETLAAVPKLVREGKYTHILIVGSGNQGHPEGSDVNVATRMLSRLGCDPNLLVAIQVPEQKTRRAVGITGFGSTSSYSISQRTYAGGLMVKQWIQATSAGTDAMDVFTVGVHARKSWILFQHAMGEGYEVGVISGPEPAYDSRRWLASKTGLYLVARNSVGYLYSLLWTLA